ncbi:MAG: hypothetical protein H7X95_09955 [Deltaproteobacteria bacterium]|nr:hypothetical protein [Deltaproteobacteria bacterium]
MRETGVTVSPAGLADVLGALRVCVTSVRVQQGLVSLDDYSGGGRPTSTVCLSGDGHVGFGENVAFTAAEHARFAANAAGLLCGAGTDGTDGRTIVGRGDARVRSDSPSNERAAVEAALIDLGMRQASVTFADLTGATEQRFRFVRSFDACADPSARVQQLRTLGYPGDFKIDVDPAWDGPTLKALAAQGGIAILDFKGRGDAALVAAVVALFPNTILEDPPPGTGPACTSNRIARDVSITDTRAVAVALTHKESINLKAPRMGGPLTVLRGLELISRNGINAGIAADITTYFGGMFEVGVGRPQARQLAALFTADAPNDLAPIPSVGGEYAHASDALIRLDAPGFGSISPRVDLQ